MNTLYWLITITDRHSTDAFLALYEEHGITVSLRTVGAGTAVRETLSTLGLEQTEKAVLGAMITAETWPGLQKDLRRKMRIDVPGTGIAFIIPVSVGHSGFFEQVFMRIGFMMTAIMAAKQGTDAIAAHQVGMNIMSLSFAFGDGLQSAAVALIGRSLGAKKPDLAKEYGRTCRLIGAGIAVCLVAIYLFGGRWLYSLFFEEQHIIEIGVSIIHVIIFVVIFQICQVIYMGCLRGAGDTLYTAVASMISVTFIRTLVSYLGGNTLGLGIVGIWFGVLADQMSRFIFATIRFKQGKWVKIKI